MASGTSLSAPAITGLVAYLLSVYSNLGDLQPTIGLTARKVKAQMLELAYARQGNYVAAFNGYAPYDSPEVCAIGAKRDVIGKRQCQRPTDATYTIDGVPLTGVPTSLSGDGQTMTAGGAPITISSITFSLPASASNGVIYVDGILTYLPAATATAVASTFTSTTETPYNGLTTSIPSTTMRVPTSSTPSYPSPTGTWNVASYTGPSTVIPSTWCDLTQSTNGTTLIGTYSTVSGATTSYCAYTSIPNSTITLSTVKPPPPPVSTSTTRIWNVASYTGPSIVIPSTWCDLTIAAADTSLTQTYSTISGASTSYCDYTTVPGSTISPSTLQPPSPTSMMRSATSSTPRVIEQSSSSTPRMVRQISSTTTTTTTTKPTFDPFGSTTLCHATFGTWTNPRNTPTSVPRIPYTGPLNTYVNDFCTTTSKNGVTLNKGNHFSWGFVPVPYTPNSSPALEPGYSTYYEFGIFLDGREECKNVWLFDTPIIEPVVPTGPYFDCWDPLQQLVNGCDGAPGLDKWGGTIERGCVMYGFQAWVGPTIKEAPPVVFSPCGILRKKRYVC